MPDIVIADTSCFIILSKVNQLHLLNKLYGTIITTDHIAKEFDAPLPAWVTVERTANDHLLQILELQVDKGEASAIALALDLPGSVVILDDLKARELAGRLGISITGTLGIIVKAKLSGIIPSIKPILNEIKKTDFRISPTLINMALEKAGE